MTLTELLKNSRQVAQDEPDAQGGPQVVNRSRGSAWLRNVAIGFRVAYEQTGQVDVRVFDRSDPTYRQDFGLNELLFDVAACRVAQTPAAQHQRLLWHVTQPLWVVESEFAQDSFEAIKDFNKLVLGFSPNKLFIGPFVNDSAGFRAALLPVAQAAANSGNVYRSCQILGCNFGSMSASGQA